MIIRKKVSAFTYFLLFSHMSTSNNFQREPTS